MKHVPLVLLSQPALPGAAQETMYETGFLRSGGGTLMHDEIVFRWNGRNL